MIWDDLGSLGRPFFALAPMNDVTDQVFREIVGRCAPPDLYFTEFISVESLASDGGDFMENKLRFSDADQPLIVQVWGINPKNYESQCRVLAEGGYAGIDINMGCPVAKIIEKGACSALINNRDLASEIIDAARRGASSVDIDFPVSVKTRIGFDEIDLSWIEFLLEQHLPALTVHCRTASEQSKVPNHFDVLDEIVSMRNRIAPETLLVANGDIVSRDFGCEIAKQYGVDGLMIGRGIFHDLFVFDDKSKWREMPPKMKLSVFQEHIELFDKTWQGSKNPEILKKFAKTYVTGFKGAPKVRDELMALRDIDSVREYVARIKETPLGI